WYVLDYPFHQGVHRLVADLNRLYASDPCLHRHDFESQGFEWIDCHDAPQSILSYLRRDGDDCAVVVLNMTPVPRHDYRIGVPLPGIYREILNSDASIYGGSDVGNVEVQADSQSWMGRPYSIRITLPPLAGIVLKPLDQHRADQQEQPPEERP
nr:alpha amylase C-terminal domain-containing protein [Methylotetracoccus sp.]